MMSSDHEPLQASREQVDLDAERGVTLTEAFSRFVEQDAVSQELRAACKLWCGRAWAGLWRDQEPGYILVPVSRVATGVLQWPQAFVISPVFENWSSPRRESWEAAMRAGLLAGDPGEEEHNVPDEIVRAQERRHELTKALIQRFRDEELGAKGIQEHPAPSPYLTREAIVSRWWHRSDLLVGFSANALFIAVGDGTELLFSDVRVFTRQSDEADSSGEAARNTAARPKAFTRVLACWQGLPDETKACVVARGGKKAVAVEIQRILGVVPLSTVERELRNVLNDPGVKSDLQNIRKAGKETGKE